MHANDLRGRGEQMNLIVAGRGAAVEVRHHLCSGSIGRNSPAGPHLLQRMLGLRLECSEVLVGVTYCVCVCVCVCVRACGV